nr:hypothetical protein MEP433_gp1 [Methylophilales phage MEP433]WOZ55683.1 hypothetical protein MEP434_gp1 [Methylophilales phage MEP434]
MKNQKKSYYIVHFSETVNYRTKIMADNYRDAIHKSQKVAHYDEREALNNRITNIEEVES